MSQKLINIAIDGYSSTGKSTLAKDLAAALGYRYVDSGAMYRGVTLYALQHNLIDGEDVSPHLLEELINIDLAFHFNPERQATDIYLNGEDVEDAIRELTVARHVSAIAAIPEVRRRLVKAQKKLADHKGVVMDGRDIGTVVLPEAELKIFVTAEEAIRTKRRYQELLGRGLKITHEEVAANLRQRDLMDTTRADSPLKQADDARVLDNSHLSRQEQLKIALEWCHVILPK